MLRNAQDGMDVIGHDDGRKNVIRVAVVFNQFLHHKPSNRHGPKKGCPLVLVEMLLDDSVKVGFMLIAGVNPLPFLPLVRVECIVKPPSNELSGARDTPVREITSRIDPRIGHGPIISRRTEVRGPRCGLKSALRSGGP